MAALETYTVDGTTYAFLDGRIFRLEPITDPEVLQKVEMLREAERLANEL